MYDGTITIKANIDTKEYDAQIEKLVSEIKDLEYELANADKHKLTSKEVEEYNAKLEIAKNKLGDLVKKKQQLNNKGFNEINSSLDKTGEKMSSIITKVGKWALAVVSVRSAYMLVRQATSTLAEYDNQIKTDLEYFKFTLAMALRPAIEGIISAMYMLLGLVNAISVSLFNYDLLSEATAKNFKKANNNAKDLKKTLTGFDEMNILTDNGTSASGGVLGDVSKDVSTYQTSFGKIKEFIDKIKKSYEDMGKMLKNPKMFQEAFGNWGTFVEGVTKLFYGIGEVFAGVFDTIVGILKMIVGVFTGNEDLITQGWQQFCDGILGIFDGLGDMLIGSIKLVFGFFKGIFLDIGDGINEKVIKPIGQHFTTMWGLIKGGAVGAYNGVTGAFKNVGNFFSGIKKGIENTFSSIGTKVGQVVGGAFRSVMNGVLELVESKVNSFISAMNTLIKTANKIPGVSISKVSKVTLPRLAVGGVINMPGKGINYGGANIGERGAEGVIPLTNSEMMAQLGEAIGKYITINASITNTMNGRVISRELQKVNNSSDFAFNR